MNRPRVRQAIILFMVLTMCAISLPAQASEQNLYNERMGLFQRMSAATGIDWSHFAAIDQYERTMNRKKHGDEPRLLSIDVESAKWAGKLNPDPEDTEPDTIALYGGVGRDGNSDGKADRNDPIDVLYTLSRHILQYGHSEDGFRIAVWEWYRNSRSVQRITQFARVYRKFDTLDLHAHAFPVPLRSNYSYRSTWGAARGWGGLRIHEGTDIFASYGVPVRSTSYGVIEVMGWNRFGGWRVGIRDMNNVYHYYAHLSGFNKKEYKEGDIVKPGDVVGWVGSSGYGKPGTQGKFPPHLHYGIYRDGGLTDWSFDPYPYLRKWERDERKARKKG